MTAQGRVVGVILASTSVWAACLCIYVATGDHRWIGGSFAAWFGGVVLTMVVMSYNAWIGGDDECGGCDDDCDGVCLTLTGPARSLRLDDAFRRLDEYPATAAIGERARERDWLWDMPEHERRTWQALRRQLDGGDDAGVPA